MVYMVDSYVKVKIHSIAHTLGAYHYIYIV